MAKIALVTGANRGIGLEVCRQLAKADAQVILTARDEFKGKEAVKKLTADGLDATFYQLDVTDEENIRNLCNFVMEKFDRLDILVNNAGILLDEGIRGLDVPMDTVRKTFEVNVLGLMRMCQAFIPLMRKNNYGRIVNFSSILGQLDSMEGGYPSYRMSKTAVNAVTRILADEVAGSNILINSVHPGWVRTDMGGPSATRSIEEGAKTPVWLCFLPDNGPSGKFFYDKHQIKW